MLSEYELVIFDCDGVLVDSESISCGTIAEIATELGFPMTTDEAITAFVGTSMDVVTTYLRPRIKEPLPSDFEQEYRNRIKQRFENELQPIPGIESVLESLTIPKCVGSNGPREKIMMNLGLTKLLSHFESHQIFSAYDIKKWKPLPDLYLYAARQMGVAPKNCVVVEDSLAGVQAAQAAGMEVIGYAGTTDGKLLKAAGAKVIFDMNELI